MSKKDFTDQEQNKENEMPIDINADENQHGTTHLNEPVTDVDDLEKLQVELEEEKDKYLRKVAEFDNFKRRNAKERMELIQTAGRDVITDLLEVLDDCDRAQQELEKNNESDAMKDGVLLVFNKLRNLLQSKGLKTMQTIGEEFDADLHDAISEIPAPSEKLKGKIIDEVQKGYYLNDKIIRHAKVVVGK